MQNKEDWTAALSQVKQQLPPTLPQCQASGSSPDAPQPHPVLGAFYTACCSRGWPLYTPEGDRRTAKRLNVETTMFDSIFPGAPIAGGNLARLSPKSCPCLCPDHQGTLHISATLLRKGVLLLSSRGHSFTKTNAENAARKGCGELGTLCSLADWWTVCAAPFQWEPLKHTLGQL